MHVYIYTFISIQCSPQNSLYKAALKLTGWVAKSPCYNSSCSGVRKAEFSIPHAVEISTFEKVGCEIQLMSCKVAVISILINPINIFNPYLT